MTLIVQDPWIDGLSMLIQIDEVVLRRQTSYQRLLIAETEAYGRTLFLDGLIQSTESDEPLYHEPLVHPALVMHGAPRHVLVGGVGEGAALREVLRHPDVASVLAVDLDAEVVAACREHLPAWSAGAFEDPRVTLCFEDIWTTLSKEDDEPFDAMILDVTDPIEDGPAAALWSTTLFSAVANRLADDGVMVVQSGEIDPCDLRLIRDVRSTLGAVFDWVYTLPLMVPSFHAIWSVTLAAKRPIDPCPGDLEARYARLTAPLRVCTPQTHRALLAMPPYLQQGMEQPGRVLTGGDVHWRRSSGPGLGPHPRSGSRSKPTGAS